MENKNGLIAICENPKCSVVFEHSGILGENSKVKFTNSRIGPCPKCGDFGIVPDGLYENIKGIIKLINGPKDSVDFLNQIEHLINEQNFKNEKELLDEIEKISPNFLESLLKIISSLNLKSSFNFLMILIPIIITIHKSYFDKTDEEIQRAILNQLVIQNKKLDEIKTNQKITIDTISSNKIGRNEKCPCGSNLKYKKCCLSKNK